jgi:uncharacterized membrane protein
MDGGMNGMAEGEDTLEQRKERLDRLRAEKARSRRLMTRVAVAVCVIALAAGIIYIVRFADLGGGGFAPASSTQGYSNDTYVSIPVTEAGTSAKYYTYDANGTTVRFFLVNGSDGKVHCAADACDVCYPLHKGYSQSGQNMRCQNCGKVFAINDIGTKNSAGGCWPSRLPFRVEGGFVRIARSDLDAKAYLFK